MYDVDAGYATLLGRASIFNYTAGHPYPGQETQKHRTDII